MKKEQFIDLTNKATPVILTLLVVLACVIIPILYYFTLDELGNMYERATKEKNQKKGEAVEMQIQDRSDSFQQKR